MLELLLFIVIVALVIGLLMKVVSYEAVIIALVLAALVFVASRL